jgi:DNA repair exonuclease SbcCD ATPase subunit
MNISSLRLRRLLTAVGVVAALVLGFGSIRVAAAWTAASAPIGVAPIPVSSIQDRLDQELARSEAMRAQLDSLAAQSTEMTSALEAAQARIAADTGHAKALADELKTAKQKLAKLAASIAKAKAAAARATVTTKAAAPAATPIPTHHGDDDGETGG